MAKEKEIKFQRAGNLSIDACVKDMFDAATGVIFNDGIDRIEFDLCVNTIITTITYLRSKRFKGESHEDE